MAFSLLSTICLFATSILAQKSESEYKPSYFCLNGKDPSSLTNKEVLKEFAKGKCSPIIIIPGLLSSKLTIDIECEELQKYHPLLFSSCGWTHCHKKWYEFWKNVPKKEYLLWVPGVTGPFNMFSFFEKTNHCWAEFMKLAVDFNKPIEKSVQDTKGFKVRVYGSSEETIGTTLCGNFSMSELSPNPFNVRQTNLFKVFFKMLNEMGYVPGLTYQSIPYDFRLSLKHNQLSKLFKNNISRLHQLTRKKVILLGHSLGNNNIHTELLNLEQDFKDKNIKVWVGVGAALSGVLKAFRVLMSGDPELMVFHKKIGVHYQAGLEAINNFFPLYELLPIDSYKLYKDEEWFKAVEKRLKYEKGEISYENSGFKFLPKITDKCSPSNYKAFETGCKLGIYNITDTYIVKIEDKEYKINQVDRLLTEYDYTKTQSQFYNITRYNTKIRATNPGVPYIAMTLRTAKTPYQYHYKKDLWHYYENDMYAEPDMNVGYGDGTITSNSLFILGLKWAYEYDHGYNNAHPVKFIDVCSVYNLKNSPYDKVKDDEPYDIYKNDFMGIKCECIDEKTPDGCFHEFLIQDREALKFYRAIFITNEKTYNEDYNKYIDSLDDDYLFEMVTLCPQIISNLQEEEFRNNNLNTKEI